VSVRFLSAVWTTVLATALAGCGGGGSGAPKTSLAAPTGPVEQPAVVRRVEPYQPAASQRMQLAQQQGPAAASKADRPDPFRVRLPPAAARRPLDLRRGPGTPVQVGIAREVAVTSNRAAMSRALKWRQASGRTTAAVSFSSEGAAGLRLGLVVRKLPADALVRGYVQGADTAFEIPAAMILEAIRRNRDAGDLSEAAQTWWTPVVDGDEVTLEISLPPGALADALDVSVPRLSHLQVRADDLNTTAKIGQAGSCEVDVNCVADSDNSSRATARMIFTAGGSSYLCTGTLLNDSSSSGTPYFLSANHCIPSQTVASSLITYWFYRSTTCNSGILDSSFRVLHSGATLLYASADTDTSFMRLNGAPPAGAVFAGWSLDAPAFGTEVAGVHHPEGDLQKYSQGAVSAFANCSSVDATDSFSCSQTSASFGNFVNTSWRSGTTEAGSSGSGLFAAGSGNRYLIGQLYGGSASCFFRDGTSWYGRLDKAYLAGLGRWLSPAGSAQEVTQRSAVYRFYNATTGAHFFTSSPAERDGVIAGNPSFNYEGVAFYAYGTHVAGSSPVYRFYNTQTGRHFYTMSPAERDVVIGTTGYTYEGPNWYAQEASGGTASAVYRFYSRDRDAHFYTISAAEKDGLVQNNPGWSLEGIGYYAWTTQ
jgi:lysyl endopeptidase